MDVAIGAIADDAGKSATRGAVAGGVDGRRQGKRAQAQQNQQSQAIATKMEQDLKNSFLKAFYAFIEGKATLVNDLKQLAEGDSVNKEEALKIFKNNADNLYESIK